MLISTANCYCGNSYAWRRRFSLHLGNISLPSWGFQWAQSHLCKQVILWSISRGISDQVQHLPSPTSIQILYFWWHRGTEKKQFCPCQQTDVWQDVSQFCFTCSLCPTMMTTWLVCTVWEQKPWLGFSWEHTQLPLPTFATHAWHFSKEIACLYFKHTKTHCILWLETSNVCILFE